jgi:AraC-like DNA-binding protein
VRRGEPGIGEAIVSAVQSALAGLGIAAEHLATKPVGAIVSGQAADSMIDHAAATLGDDALGLTLATKIPIGSLGVIDYGFCTSATLSEALRLVARYYGVATQRVRLVLIEDAQPAQLVFHREIGSPHWVDFAAAVIALRIRQTLGREQLAFSRVAFRHAPPANREVYDAFFGSRVEFAAELDCLAFDAALLGRQLLTASHSLAELLEQRMSELDSRLAMVDPLLDRVRRTLVAMLDDGHTDLATLARHMGESTRTLQRLLRDRATSHKQLVDELRRDRATEWLDRGLRVVDVAKRLGFSDPSAFAAKYCAA